MPKESLAIPVWPYLVGEVVPGYCCGTFGLDTMGHDLRVEAVGVDWLVLRGQDDDVHFYNGSHQSLREDAAWTMQRRESGEI